MLRCVELGLSQTDLEYLEIGMVLDMLTERANDDCKYSYLATQGDFDRF